MTNYARVIPERCNIETKTTVIVQLTIDSFLNLYCWRYFSSLTGVKENENFESGDSGILENENKILEEILDLEKNCLCNYFSLLREYIIPFSFKKIIFDSLCYNV